eukprot:GFUD01043580.1.p1 GENE.GFUD01043580.1~~GFUD01043580.1.p1  ORF type:complete len:390 (-),score=69.88 GFUD01043580.1:67-1236(-)
MGPKRIKMLKVEENYEEELAASKAGLDDKNEEIEALKVKATNDLKKHAQTIETFKSKMNTALEVKNEEIETIKEEMETIEKKAANDLKNHEKTVQNFALMKNDDKTEIDNLKRKLQELVKAKNIVDQLKEKIECPVCFEIPHTGPVPVCRNGHFVCNECKAEACPTCRVNMGSGKSLLAMTVVENIDHRCKFIDCEEFFPVDEIEKHAKVCAHRSVSCPCSKCDVKVGLSKLLAHLNNSDCSYDSQVILKKTSLIEKVSAVKTLTLNASEQRRYVKSAVYRLNTFTFEDISFCIFIEKREWLYHFSLVMFASEEECSKYKIEMAVHEPNVSSEDTEVSFKYCGKPCSIDVDKKEFHGLTVDAQGMEQIWSKSTTLAFSVSFSVRKIPNS